MLLNAGVIGASAGGGTWTPADITTALWLDASDSSTLFDATTGGSLPAADGTIARWEDKSTNNRHATQGTIGFRPIRKVAIQNSLDGVQFDDADDWLETSAIITGTGARQIFAVARTANTGRATITAQGSSTSGNGVQFNFQFNRLEVESLTLHSFGADGGTPANVATMADFNIVAIELASSSNAGSTDFYANGVKYDFSGSNPSTSINTSASNFRIGHRITSAEPLNGVILELIVITGTLLSTDDRQRVEGYYAHKWGVTARLASDHPYKTVAP